jgi:hypothetical protein
MVSLPSGLLLQFLYEFLNSPSRVGLGSAKELVPFVKCNFYTNKVDALKIPHTESFVSKNVYWTFLCSILIDYAYYNLKRTEPWTDKCMCRLLQGGSTYTSLCKMHTLRFRHGFILHPLKRIWYANFIPANVTLWTDISWMYTFHSHKNTYTPSFISAFRIQNLLLPLWQLRCNTRTQGRAHTDVVQGQ